MQENWSQQTQALQDWRANLGQALIDIQQDTAIFSHYVAINAAVGFAEGKDQVMVFRPNNASITVFETDGQSLTLVSRGDEAETKVN
jgi:broad specificity phosphatase PhoE